MSVNKMGLQTSQLRICSMLLWLYQARLKMYYGYFVVFICFSLQQSLFSMSRPFLELKKERPAAQPPLYYSINALVLFF